MLLCVLSNLNQCGQEATDSASSYLLRQNNTLQLGNLQMSGCFFLRMLLDFPVLLLPTEKNKVKFSLEKSSVSESPDSPASEFS